MSMLSTSRSGHVEGSPKTTGVDWTPVSRELNFLKSAWDAYGRDASFFVGAPDPSLALLDGFGRLAAANNGVITRISRGEGVRVSNADEQVLGIMELLGKTFQVYASSRDQRSPIDQNEGSFKDIGALLRVAQLVIAAAQTTNGPTGSH